MCPTHPVTLYHYRCQHSDNQVLLLSPTLPTDLLWLHVCHTHPVTPYMISANRMTTKFSSCPPTLPIDLLWLQQNDNQVFLLSYNTVMSQVPVYLFTCYSCQHEFCYRHTEFFVLFCLLTCYGSQLNNTSFDIVPQHMLLVPFYWPVKAADGTTKILLWFHFPNSRHLLYWWILQSNIPSPKWGKTNSTVEMTHHPNLTFIIQLYNHSQIS